MKDKLAKVISIITIAPVMALIMLLFLYIARHDMFGSPLFLLIAVLSLSVIPTLGYPLQYVFPVLREGGRDEQRKLAFISAVAGYMFGVIMAILLKAPVSYKMILISYALSGTVLALFNICHIKASGHACGVGGPAVLCSYFLGGYGWLVLLLIPAIFWARLHMKRHRLPELVLGSAISIISACVVIDLF